MSSLKQLNKQQIRSLAGGFVSMLIYGSAYTYGTMVPYLTSFIYYNGDVEITPNKMASLLPISILVLNLGMPLNNISQLQFPHRITTLISIVGICLTVLTMSFGDQFWHFLILYGIVFGLFIGYGYLAPIKNCYEHIPHLKGLCSGVCILGFGISSLLFNLILLKLINPENQETTHLPDGRKVYSLQVANNVPFALRIMSAIYLAIGLVGIFLMKPPRTSQNPLLELSHDEEPPSIISQDSNDPDSPVRLQNKTKEGLLNLLLRKKIHLLTLTLTCSVPFGIFVAFNYKQYGMLAIKDDEFLTLVGSLGAIFNGFGRLCFGMLLDKLSYKIISIVINSILLVFAFVLPFIVEIKPLFLISVCCIYFAYGGNYSIYPTHTVKVLGNELGGKVYFLVFGGFSIGTIIQWMARLFLVPVGDQLNGFRTCFYIFGGLNLAAIILSFFVPYVYQEEQKVQDNQT